MAVRLRPRAQHRRAGRSRIRPRTGRGVFRCGDRHPAAPQPRRAGGFEAGTARLVGIDPDVIVLAVRRLLRDQAAYQRMAGAINPHGDGRAAARVVAALAHFFGVGPRAGQFVPVPGAVRPD
ncbi:UDP-N-acetylglucosamine 2-epimerase [Actinoallomurus sp. CA-150999]|uniref:UDP-N-acetylglucosamine 2-epimerase n=1 Tax=Actinoallomurus sp. CA-150999 TaxID=3239887 RepID=UPI003D91C16E